MPGKIHMLENHPFSYTPHFVKLPSCPRRDQKSDPSFQLPRRPVLYEDLRIELQPQDGAQNPVMLNLRERFVTAIRQVFLVALSNDGVASRHFGELRESGIRVP